MYAWQLFAKTWFALGKVAPLDQFKATSGSSTTEIENTAIATREEGPDDNQYIDFTAIVVHDAAGASAAPEGEMQRVSAYDSSTYKFTVDTAFSLAVGAGDEVWLASPDIPLLAMYEAANSALLRFGDVTNVNATLTLGTASKIALPSGTKRDAPIQVKYADSDDDDRLPLTNWTISPDGYLFIPDAMLVDGRKLYLTYKGLHTPLTAFSSTISDDLSPAEVIAATTAAALEWLNGTLQGGTSYWLQRENKALNDLAAARVQDQKKKYAKQSKWFSTGRAEDEVGY